MKKKKGGNGLRKPVLALACSTRAQTVHTSSLQDCHSATIIPLTQLTQKLEWDVSHKAVSPTQNTGNKVWGASPLTSSLYQALAYHIQSWNSSEPIPSTKDSEQQATNLCLQNKRLLTRSSTKLLAPFPESGAREGSVDSANRDTFFLGSNQGSCCPFFSELQQLSAWGSLGLSRGNSLHTVFPEVSRLLGSAIQLPRFWIKELR